MKIVIISTVFITTLILLVCIYLLWRWKAKQRGIDITITFANYALFFEGPCRMACIEFPRVLKRWVVDMRLGGAFTFLSFGLLGWDMGYHFQRKGLDLIAIHGPFLRFLNFSTFDGSAVLQIYRNSIWRKQMGPYGLIMPWARMDIVWVQPALRHLLTDLLRPWTQA